MDALILSCSTGGGHNAAGVAVMEELERRGHRVTMLDPYKLAGKNLDRKVGNGYIKVAQKTPRLFGLAYMLGNGYRRLPIHSPVYTVNKMMIGRMSTYLETHPFDVIIMPHVFPGEILTGMKNKGLPVPKLIFVATDYTCIPFTEEIDCDYYVTPSAELNAEFTARGIAAEKLIPAGIPVKKAFTEPLSREQAKINLGLEPQKRYLLLCGGSIGAGKIAETVGVLRRYIQAHAAYHLITVCGNNRKLYVRLLEKYGGDPAVTVLAGTERMADYMKACELCISKPGGLSSTEAAAAEIPLIHISPIPGCENSNMRFFAKKGLSLAVGNDIDRLPDALRQLQCAGFAAQMRENQKKEINKNAAAQICDLAEQCADSPC